MAVVDRNVLRLAVHELLAGETPVAVAIDEGCDRREGALPGRPVARLVPVAPEPVRRTPGSARGKVTITASFDAPLPDEIGRAFE